MGGGSPQSSLPRKPRPCILRREAAGAQPRAGDTYPLHRGCLICPSSVREEEGHGKMGDCETLPG